MEAGGIYEGGWHGRAKKTVRVPLLCEQCVTAVRNRHERETCAREVGCRSFVAEITAPSLRRRLSHAASLPNPLLTEQWHTEPPNATP